MATQTIDLAAAEWAHGPRIGLLQTKRIEANGNGDEYVADGEIGFDEIGELLVRAHVSRFAGTDTPVLTLIVEHRDTADDAWEEACSWEITERGRTSVLKIDQPKARIRARYEVAGTNPRFTVSYLMLTPETDSNQLSETYAGAHSYQSMAADLELAAGAGKDTDSAFLAAGMWNLLGDALTKTKNYLAGAIGALSVTGARAALFQVGAVLGVVMDGVTEADGAVVAIIDGSDPSAETRATAAFAARMNNNHAASGVDYGLDLYDPGRDDLYSDPGPGLPLAIAKADLRLSYEVCILSGAGAPVDYTDGDPPATGQGYAGPGSLYIDRVGFDIWMNDGTSAEPTWTQKSA
jgi:hypothetical protein